MLENSEGISFTVNTEALSNLFRLFKNDIGCVLLNCCFSNDQARGIGRHIKYVVGTDSSINDNAAIMFSAGFYRAVGYGENFERAFDFGVNQVQMSNDADFAKFFLYRDGAIFKEV